MITYTLVLASFIAGMILFKIIENFTNVNGLQEELQKERQTYKDLTKMTNSITLSHFKKQNVIEFNFWVIHILYEYIIQKNPTEDEKATILTEIRLLLGVCTLHQSQIKDILLKMIKEEVSAEDYEPEITYLDFSFYSDEFVINHKNKSNSLDYGMIYIPISKVLENMFCEKKDNEE